MDHATTHSVPPVWRAVVLSLIDGAHPLPGVWHPYLRAGIGAPPGRRPPWRLHLRPRIGPDSPSRIGPAMTRHGTVGGYSGGCRCSRCRQAMADYRRARRRVGLDGGRTMTGASGGAGRGRGTGSSWPTATATSRPTRPTSAGQGDTWATIGHPGERRPRASVGTPTRTPSAGPRPRAWASSSTAAPARGSTFPGQLGAGMSATGHPSLRPDTRYSAARPVPDPVPAGTIPDADMIRRQAARLAPSRTPPAPSGPFGGQGGTARTRALWRRLRQG